MKNQVQIGFFMLLSVCLLMACSQEPKPIEYGTDACHFCRMTIVDKVHGAEIVTDKGKVIVGYLPPESLLFRLTEEG